MTKRQYRKLSNFEKAKLSAQLIEAIYYFAKLEYNEKTTYFEGYIEDIKVEKTIWTLAEELDDWFENAPKECLKAINNL